MPPKVSRLVNPTGTVFHWSLNRAPEPDRGGQSQGPLLAIMFTAETVT